MDRYTLFYKYRDVEGREVKKKALFNVEDGENPEVVGETIVEKFHSKNASREYCIITVEIGWDGVSSEI